MRRALGVLLSVALLAPVSAAIARDDAPGEVELMIQSCESLLADLAGHRAGPPVFRDLGGGIYSVSVEVAGDPESFLAAGPRSLVILSTGQQRAIPNNPGFLATPAVTDARLTYNFWWAVWNRTDEPIMATSRLTLRGPGLRLDESSELEYPASSVSVFWFGSGLPLERAGLYTQRIKVEGASPRSVRVLAQ